MRWRSALAALLEHIDFWWVIVLLIAVLYLVAMQGAS